MAGTTIAIQCRGVSKLFGTHVVLSDLDLEIVEGESVALTGANGAGKTTLLRCLASVIRPNTGEVRWFGRSAARDLGARRLVGMVAHESRLYPQLSLRENLIFAARMYDVREPARQADRLLESIGLKRYAEHVPAHVSQGMRQRVTVVRALVHDPPIVLLDEPFAGLDTAGTEWLVHLLLDLRGRGRTLCFALHDEQKTQRLAGRILKVQCGRVWEPVACETPEASNPPAARAA